MAGIEHEGQPELLIETAVDPEGYPLVSVSGELDSTNADSLKKVVLSVTASRPPRVFFELSGLRFIDSAGLAVLLTVARESTVHLRNPSSIARRVIEATGLAGVLLMEP